MAKAMKAMKAMAMKAKAMKAMKAKAMKAKAKRWWRPPGTRLVHAWRPPISGGWLKLWVPIVMKKKKAMK